MTLKDYFMIYYFVYGFFGSTIIAMLVFDDILKCPFISGMYEPIIFWVKRNSEMNWFGCVMTTILLFIVFPLFFTVSFLINLLYWIAKVIYWITHV